ARFVGSSRPTVLRRAHTLAPRVPIGCAHEPFTHFVTPPREAGVRELRGRIGSRGPCPGDPILISRPAAEIATVP
ncbi:MAG TPA: hypothetical protein VJU16_06305, partial [Planctomycetota bacterium]|nr:hypothetical protein [Planctomycetota bacterium]